MPRITITQKKGPGHTSSQVGPGELVRKPLLTHTGRRKKGGTWRAEDLDAANAALVLSSRFSEIDTKCEEIELPYAPQWTDQVHLAEIQAVGKEERTWLVSFPFTKNFENWTKPYSAKQFSEEISAIVETAGDAITFRRVDGSAFNLRCQVRSLHNFVGDEIEHWASVVKSLYSAATEELQRKSRSNSLLTVFEFPAPLRSSCEQYLLYFGQFLEDLGITADSELKEEAGRVLFSITPKDGKTALKRVREALEVYLELPRNPEFSATTDEFQDTAVAQLRANVFFLRSQLALAQATIQLKDAAIQALDIARFRELKPLAGSPNRDNENSVDSRDKDEPILGDTVHLTRYEGKVLKVDLPTILRRLKRSFGIGADREEPKI